MDGPARAPAVRAAAAGSRAVRGDVEEARAVARDPLDAAARHGAEFVHAPSYGAPPATPNTSAPSRSTQSVGEPRQRGRLTSLEDLAAASVARKVACKLACKQVSFSMDALYQTENSDNPAETTPFPTSPSAACVQPIAPPAHP